MFLSIFRRGTKQEWATPYGQPILCDGNVFEGNKSVAFASRINVRARHELLHHYRIDIRIQYQRDILIHGLSVRGNSSLRIVRNLALSVIRPRLSSLDWRIWEFDSARVIEPLQRIPKLWKITFWFAAQKLNRSHESMIRYDLWILWVRNTTP